MRARINDDELIAAIQGNSDLDDRHEVERAAYATLTVLGLRLARRFPLDEFYDRVGQLEGTTHHDARRHARAVMAGVKAAIDRYEWDTMIDQLPADYADLLVARPVH